MSSKKVKATMSVNGGPEVPLDKVKELADKVKALPESDQQIVKGIVGILNESDQGQITDNIRDLDMDIFITKGRIKVLNERIEEIKVEHTSYNEMIKAKQAYEKARENFRLTMLSDSDYNDTMENVATEKQKLADQKDMLSLHIVEYYTKTKERQVEIGDDGDARDLIVTGKLGARGKYQTNLFSDSAPAEPKAEQEKLV